MLLASFNYGNPVIGVLLLPFFLALPWAMLFVEVRSILRGEALSRTLFVLLLLMEGLALYLAWIGVFHGLSMVFGFWKTWALALLLATSAAPFILAYEAYKNGWLDRLIHPPRKKKKRKHKKKYEQLD